MSAATSVFGQEQTGRDFDSGSASVPGSRSFESEVLGQFDSGIGVAGSTDGDLESGDGVGGILCKRGENSAATAVGDLLVVRDSR